MSSESPKPGQKTAMISSTSLDLPEHRQQAIDACLRQSVFPIAMEQLPARDADAIRVSTEMVERADIYIGIFAWRYGHVPEGHDISITEMEFNRAVEREIPILVFTIHKDHTLTIEMVETDKDAQAKLKRLKERACDGLGRLQFSSPVELRSHIIQSIGDLKAREQQASGETPVPSFHRHYDILQPPEPFIAHPYTLLQTHRLVGRQAELNLLTDWVAKPQSQIYSARILNVVAIGGMGKSALTWKWFNEIAPQEMKPMAGRMWWSFYESDATFENFVTRALAYTTRRPLAEVEQIPALDRESQLLSALDREPFLIVLDGLERMLIAYARMDAAHLDALGSQASPPAGSAEETLLPEGAPVGTLPPISTPAREDAGVPRLRKTADPRAGSFLRKLANVAASKILVSTRLYPADLQSKVNGNPINGCFALFLPGLSDDDALELWRAFEVSGARDHLLPLFNRVENHSLLIQALASQVARYRPAPGDFERWRQDHPDFDPFSLPLVQVKSHVLEFALHGLGDQARQALQTIAAFRMPASYNTLTALLIGEAKPCADERELDAVLAELEDRGLVGWDKRANRYDLHPIVRGVVWSGLGNDTRRGVYTNLHAHFEAVPTINEKEISRLEDLAPAIELYNTLIGLGRYDDAQSLFFERLEKVLHNRLGTNRQRIELLEMLFPDGLEQLPRLSKALNQILTLSSLAQAYRLIGQPGRSASLYRRQIKISSEVKDHKSLGDALFNLPSALRMSGALYETEALSYHALAISREQFEPYEEGVCLNLLGLTQAARGIVRESLSIIRRALRIDTTRSDFQGQGVDNADLAQWALWTSAFAVALSFANSAWKLAHDKSYERDFIRAARRQGEAALGLYDLNAADERLHHALTRARQVNLAEEEISALIALAELRRQQDKPDEAREFLDDLWEAAERGPYPLFHADACNVLTALERDAGNTTLAIEAATQAYRLAWCDGPPYAYHWGLEAARKHLRELGAPEPQLPPFDASKFEPMPDVEINPKDEFYVGVSEAE